LVRHLQVIEKLFRERWGKYDGLGALVLTPTRELAFQIFDELRKVLSLPCIRSRTPVAKPPL
jgi:superfamily II DNA/RNA helicase